MEKPITDDAAKHHRELTLCIYLMKVARLGGYLTRAKALAGYRAMETSGVSSFSSPNS